MLPHEQTCHLLLKDKFFPFAVILMICVSSVPEHIFICHIGGSKGKGNSKLFSLSAQMLYALPRA